MPFINNAGVKPWADVISDTGDGINRSIQGVQSHNAGVDKQNETRKESNRAVHPLAQKYLQKVLGGEMAPDEAAALAHAEIDADGNGVPDAQERGLAGNAKLGEDETAAVGGLSALPAAPKPIVRGTGPVEPVRNRDMGVMEEVLKNQAAMRPRNGLTNEEWTRREDVKTANKGKVIEAQGEVNTKRDTAKAGFRQNLQTAVNEGRMTQVEAQLAATKEIEWQKHLDRMMALEERLLRANNAVEVAKINAESRELAAAIRTAGSIRSSIPQLAQDPDALSYAKELETRVRRGTQHIVQDSGGEGAAPSPSLKGAIDSVAQPPPSDAGTPDISSDLKSAAPKLKALDAIPAPKMKTNSSNGYWMKFPGGITSQVSKEKLADAQARGGVPTAPPKSKGK